MTPAAGAAAGEDRRAHHSNGRKRADRPWARPPDGMGFAAVACAPSILRSSLRHRNALRGRCAGRTVRNQKWHRHFWVAPDPAT
jgi:hypothetical protein